MTPKTTITMFALIICIPFVAFACVDEPIRSEAQPAKRDAPNAIDAAACRDAVADHCARDCIATSSDPSKRPACEVACRKQPAGSWDGKIPECTPGL